MNTNDKVNSIIEIDQCLKEVKQDWSQMLKRFMWINRDIDNLQKEIEKVLVLMEKINKANAGRYRFFRTKFRARIQDVKEIVELLKTDVEEFE